MKISIRVLSFAILLAAPCAGQGMWSPAPVGGPTIERGAAVGVWSPGTLAIVHGGIQGGSVLNQTWGFNTGLGWTSVGLPSSDPARFGHAVAADPIGNFITMFGGHDGVSYRGDTWVINGPSFFFWTIVSNAGPAKRASHAMAPLQPGAGTLLFGGTDGGQVFGDTWKFVASQWQQLSTVPAPPPRYGHAMAYDPLLSGVVLFGGTDGSTEYSDTWLFDGNGWRELALARHPSKRSEHAMARASAIGGTLLYGGESNGQALSDAWILDHTGWHRALAYEHNGPGPRAGHGLGFLSFDQDILLVGGAASGDSFTAQTSATHAEAEVFGQGCPGSYGTPELVPAPGQVPYLGSTFTMALWNLPFLTGNGAVGFLGSSNTVWTGITLPRPLDGLGLPGCQQLVSLDTSVALANLGGFAQWSTAIPPNPDLLGGVFYAQALVFDPLANPFGATVSNGLELQIGMLGPALNITEITEDFASAAKLDRDHSSGTWGNGQATFGTLGGSGVLGSFDATDGTNLGGGVYLWMTTAATIPGRHTLTGQPITVTDGLFEFSEFVVPQGVTVRFSGAVPAVIRASGRIRIEGTIDAGGAASPGTIIGSQSVVALPGTLGGPGAGSGGNGGAKGNGLGPSPVFDGDDGEDVVVPAGHAYAAQTVGTGGQGSTQFPVTGLNSSIQFLSFFSQMLAGGGGGGGLITPGGIGRAISTTASPPPPAGWLAPDTNGGVAFDILSTLTRPAGTPSLDYYLVGGSGGGGTGSHALFTSSFAINWWNGNGGTGGGGALALRAGNRIEIPPGGEVSVRGGKGCEYVSAVFTPAQNTPAPGGAGSGGSLLLQSAGTVDLPGILDMRGGRGGQLDVNSPTLVAKGQGGDGGRGLLRLELPLGATAAALPGALPPATTSNTGVLTDRDDAAAFRSKYYRVGTVLSVSYGHYEIEALVNGQPMLYSDDPAVSPFLAVPGQAPVHVRWQGQSRDPLTGGAMGAPGPWVDRVGSFGGHPSLDDERRNSFRFHVVLDRSLGVDVVLIEVKVVLK